MSEIRTRDEAIAAVDRAFAVWATTVTGVLTQAKVVADNAQAEAERIVRRRAAVVSALEARLSAADEDNKRRLRAEMVQASAVLDQARRASVRIADVAVGVGQLVSSHGRYGTAQVAAARGQLATMCRAIERYRAEGVGGGSGGSGVPSGGARGSFDLSSVGLSEVPVSSPDLLDTSGQQAFGRGGATRADYRWAVQTWIDTVGPGVAKGMTRDDFAARDKRNAAPDLRRTADVYDMFLGVDRIRVNRRPDGSVNIVNGRHRLQIARDLGIKSLPGQVS